MEVIRCSWRLVVLPVFAVFFLATVVTAGNRVGAAYLNSPLSVRQMGMGNVSLVGGDPLAGWSNPALLALCEARGEVAANGSSMMGGRQTAAGMGIAWYASPRNVVGGYLSYFKCQVREIDEYGETLNTILDRSLACGALATALSLKWLSLGVAVKSVSDRVVGNSANFGAADVGLMTAWRGLALGVVRRNLGADLRQADPGFSESESLPVETRIALSYAQASCRLLVASEYVLTEDVGSLTMIGVEWWPVKYAGFRLGAADISRFPEGLTFGLSVVRIRFSMDYALNYHPLGLSHRINLSYSFGPRVVWPASTLTGASGFSVPGVE